MGYLSDGDIRFVTVFFCLFSLTIYLLATTIKKNERKEKTLSQIVPGQKLNNFMF